MKCEITGQQIQETYLKKFNGTYVKDAKGKLHAISAQAQNKYNNDKKQILQAIGAPVA